MFSDSISGFPDLSEERSSSCKRFFIDLVGTGRFTFNNKHIFCVLRFPDRSQICLGFGWVGLENFAC